MNWIRNMLRYFYKINKKHMTKLGLDYRVYLLQYPARSIGSGGITTYEKPVVVNLPRAVMVPFAAYRFGRVFGEQLNRQFRGEYKDGDNILFVDKKLLHDNDIDIDLELDRIQWDTNQYKLIREGKYPHYMMVGLYLARRVAEAFED